MLDRQSSLLWTAADTGTVLSWPEAQKIVEDLATAGHADWRLPTPDELASLYDASLEGYVPPCTGTEMRVRVPPEFNLSCALYWSSEADEMLATQFNFFHGVTTRAQHEDEYGFGAYLLAVRAR